MIGRLVEWSVAHRRFVVGLVLVLGAMGLGVTFRLELDAMPDITTNQVLVLTEETADDIMDWIIAPI